MLSDRVKELLCRAVDGDLDDRQRRKLQRLLIESEEARNVYHRLRGDSEALRRLPRRELPKHFSTEVLRSIGHESITPSTVARTAQTYLPMWANLIAALSVLLAVSVGTYLVVTINDQQRAERLSAQLKSRALDSSGIRRFETPAPIVAQDNGKAATAEIGVLPMPRSDDENAVASIPMPDLPEPSEPESPRVITAQFSDAFKAFRVEMPKLPPILPLRELDKAIHRTVLMDTLKGDVACHLDLFSKDANRGIERVNQILRAQGKPVLVEALAQQRLLAKVKTNFVLYCESMTPDEVCKLFALLAVEERKTDSSLFDKVVALPMSTNSQRTLATLLGVDPKQFNAKPKSATAPDPLKPISDATAEKIAKALAEKDRPAGARPPEGAVLELSFNPVRPNPALSREIREFLAGRKERKPGTLALMLVVRNID